MSVQNAQVEEPKIVEEARNKQKEKRSEALEKVFVDYFILKNIQKIC